MVLPYAYSNKNLWKNDFIDVRKSFMDINLFIISFGNDFVLVSKS